MPLSPHSTPVPARAASGSAGGLLREAYLLQPDPTSGAYGHLDLWSTSGGWQFELWWNRMLITGGPLPTDHAGDPVHHQAAMLLHALCDPQFEAPARAAAWSVWHTDHHQAVNLLRFCDPEHPTCPAPWDHGPGACGGQWLQHLAVPDLSGMPRTRQPEPALPDGATSRHASGLVWIAVERDRVEFHHPDGGDRTSCDRSTHSGETHPLGYVLERFNGRPCPGCFPDGTPT